MSIATRTTLLGILVLVTSQAPASATLQVVIKHNWCVAGPGGHYGVFQFQTGPGPFDAHTALLFGARHAEIPLPLFVIIFAVAVPAVALVALFCQSILSEDSSAANRRMEPDAAMTPLAHVALRWRGAADAQR
ncbi:MAG TPA: hypothetical protein VFE51_29840 [Verrucomicrobiae bacterium]|nr:hypothetical protein [Verrucomicrobiae bacterium]